MSTATTGHAPNPGLIFETFNMYQRTAALKAAIELDVFSAIAKGNKSPEEIAQAVGASTANKARGVRILCDFLTMMGFLSKESEQYALGMDASIFLVKGSPGYMGGATRFILDPKL